MTDPEQHVSPRGRPGAAALAVAALIGLVQAAIAAGFGQRAIGALASLGLLAGGVTWFALTAGWRLTGRPRSRASKPQLDVRRHLEALADTSEALSAALSRDEVAAAVVGRGTAAMNADICTLYVLDERDDTLELIGEAGVAPPVLQRIRRIAAGDDNPSFATLKSQRPLWVESEEEYKHLFPALASIPSQGPRARAFWSMPLVVEGRPIGLLGMGFHEPRAFTPEDRRFVEAFTGYCAPAVRRAQRLETERRLRITAERAETSLSTTLRSIGDAVITTDKDGRVTFMNPVAERLTGWKEGEARNRPLRQVFHIVNQDSRQEIESPVDRVLREGAVVGLANHTVLLGRQPGQETPIDDSAAPIRDESGVHGVVLVFRDVTRKKLEEARRTLLADAGSALASSLDHDVGLTRLAQLLVPRFGDWCAIDVREPDTSAARRLVVTHADPAKVQLAKDLAERYPNAAGDGASEVLRTGQSQLHPEITDEMLRHAARDDEHRRILRGLQLRSAMSVPLRAREQTLGAITLVYAESGRRYDADDLIFLEDVARRAAISIDNARLYQSERRAHASSVVANRTKDEFLATISHELRTPLNAILGWARLMAKTPNDEARRTRATEVIERNATAMAQLIEDLLDVSRIISGKVRLEVDSVEVERVIQAAADSVRLGLEAKELQLHIAVNGAPGPVLGDATRLQQVMWNLLSNAVKFTPKGGHIDVTAERRGTFVDIVVSDTGRGITADFLPYVFDPFRQGDGTITRAQGGLGLGLAISRHLVELHGGTIQAHSPGEGQGATFTVALPCAAAQQTRAQSGQPSEPISAGKLPRAPQLEGVKVLAVDDDADARQLIQVVLEECGAVVRVASSVAEAVRAIEEQVPDVLLSDIGMPGQDGYTLIRHVRALPPGAGGTVPAAALTAYTRAEDRIQALDAGFAMHVPKPVAPDELIDVVMNLTQMARPGEE